jgi:hypothetical protein
MRLVAAVIVTLCFASPASALAPEPPEPYTVTVSPEGCAPISDAGCSRLDTNQIFVRPDDHYILAHEKGHIFDHQLLTDEQRAWFVPRLKFEPGTPWSDGPAEMFADAYAACALSMHPRGGWITGVGWYPSVRRHRRVCRTLWALWLVGEVRAHR